MTKLLYFFALSTIMISACNEKTLIGNCIILDGASSSGKSTLARCLQKILPGKWEIMHHSSRAPQAIAQAKNIGLIPDDYEHKSLPLFLKTARTAIYSYGGDERVEKQRAWQQINYEWRKSFYQDIAQRLQAGGNVIVDTSLYKKQDLIIAQQALQPYNPFFICVHISFEKLVERVSARNAGDDHKEYRFLNQVIHQYACCYCAQETKDVHTVDTLFTDTVQEIVNTYCHCPSDTMSAFLPTGDQLIQEVITIMGISSEYSSFIRPRLLHDITVDTCGYSAQRASIYVRDAFLHYLHCSEANKIRCNIFAHNDPEVLYDNQK